MTNQPPDPPREQSELRKQVQHILGFCSWMPEGECLHAPASLENADIAEIDAIEALLSQATQEATVEAEAKAIGTLAKAQLNMRPLIALKNGNGVVDDNWYVMYWDESEQVWSRARYADIIKEAKAQLDTQSQEQV